MSSLTAGGAAEALALACRPEFRPGVVRAPVAVLVGAQTLGSDGARCIGGWLALGAFGALGGCGSFKSPDLGHPLVVGKLLQVQERSGGDARQRLVPPLGGQLAQTLELKHPTYAADGLQKAVGRARVARQLPLGLVPGREEAPALLAQAVVDRRRLIGHLAQLDRRTLAFLAVPRVNGQETPGVDDGARRPPFALPYRCSLDTRLTGARTLRRSSPWRLLGAP